MKVLMNQFEKMNREVRLEIIEQPKQRGMRFRYECEGRSAGSIPGENTTNDKKTWPACQITNYQGMAVIRVSLVSKDDPPRPHPHSLVGRDCNNGICQITIDPSSQMQGLFPNLGIQCVRRKEVSSAIRERLKLGVNPFDATINGDERSAIDVDLNIVRLCFEAFLPDHHGNYTQRLQPVVSNPIYDKKATSSSVLKICRVDKTSGSVLGKEEVFLLCDKVQKEDIQVVFSHEGWEALGDFSSPDVHRQVAIVFKTPPYRDEHIQENVDVEVKLRRPSDMETSAPLVFTYIAVHQGYNFPTKSLLPNSLMVQPMSNPLNSRFREAIMHKAKRAHPSDNRADRGPVKRPSPMPMPMPMRPGPSRPYYPPHPIMHRPSLRPLTSIPHQPSIKKESAPIDFSPFPSSQSTFATTPSTSSNSFAHFYSPASAAPVSNASLLPSINQSITDQPGLTYEFGMESLPSLSSLPSLGIEGSEGLLNATLASTTAANNFGLLNATLSSTTAANNFPKLEDPYMDREPLDINLDTLMQNCSIEKTEPNNFVQMLEGTSNNPVSSFIPVSNVFDSMSQQQHAQEMMSPPIHQQQPRGGDPRLFSPPPPQMPSPSVTPHQQASVMSPHAAVNSMSHHTRPHYSVGPTQAYSSTSIMSPLMEAMSPHGAMSPSARGSIMSPPGHDHMPVQPGAGVMSPGPVGMNPHPPPGSLMELQHVQPFNRPPQQGFHPMRNNNNNNNNPLLNNVRNEETTESLEEFLKDYIK